MEHVTEPKLLGTIPSKSSNRSYEIRLGADGRTYCTCTAWKMNKYCKHLEEWNALAARATVTTTVAPHVPEIPISIDQAYKKLVNKYLEKHQAATMIFGELGAEELRIINICEGIKTGVWAIKAGEDRSEDGLQTGNNREEPWFKLPSQVSEPGDTGKT